MAVVRLSGPLAHSVTQQTTGMLPPFREMRLRTFRDQNKVVLDQGLVVVFPSEASFTGDEVAEWHLHGSVAVQRGVLAYLSSIEGVRPAEPGEFTRRALWNNRLDIAQVEGLGDLLDAETSRQRELALKRLGGKASTLVERWRKDLTRASGLLEATIDFSEEDVPDDVRGEVMNCLESVLSSLREQILGSRAGERLQHGYEVAIVGRPNTGKSTLLNMLAGREAAITSEIAGTTRDVVEVRMDVAGLPVTWLDTAGVRQSLDPIETIGVERGAERASSADLRIVLLEEPDAALPVDVEEDDIVVLGRGDLWNNVPGSVSGLTGFGVNDLLDRVRGVLEKRADGASVFDRARHRSALVRAAEALTDAMDGLTSLASPELVVEEIRVAAHALETLTGRIGVEDLLDEIFSTFCIGK